MNEQSKRPSRRRFLKQVGSTAVVGLAAPYFMTSRALGDGNTPPASERVRVGLIGVGNQGGHHLKRLVRQTVAVCDVDRVRLESARQRVEKSTGSPCAAYEDFRALLDDPGVDAVVIATPDHWHALITVYACQAGKDVYCEKPLTLTIREGRAMVRAARRYRRIVQTGSQQRSDQRFRRACELVRSGRLGKVQKIEVGLPGVNFKGPPVPDSDPPPELNYDLWLGPAPYRPYNRKHVHYNFRFFWDYSGGQLTNWGAHHLDIVQWALGMDSGGPVSIEGEAKYHPEGWYEVPQWFRVRYRYASGVPVDCGNGLRHGITFHGERGTLFVTRGKLEADPPELLRESTGDRDVHLYESSSHFGNWFECIKTRRLPICDVEIGHRSATVCHLGNIAVRTGHRVHWDPATERILDDPPIAGRVHYRYRPPWKLPGV